jgi:hypothetical protein
MASNARVRLLTALLDVRAVIPVILGETPLERDVTVDVNVLESIIKEVQSPGKSGGGRMPGPASNSES